MLGCGGRCWVLWGQQGPAAARDCRWLQGWGALCSWGGGTVAVKAASREGGTPATLFFGGVGGGVHRAPTSPAAQERGRSSGICRNFLGNFAVGLSSPQEEGFWGRFGQPYPPCCRVPVPGRSVTCGGRGATARAELLSVCCSSLRRAGAKCHLWHAAVVPKPGLLLSGYGLGLL